VSTPSTVEETFALVAAERRELADLLDALDEVQWDTPSLCADWRLRDVVAHLLMEVTIGAPRLLLGMATHRFDFDRFAHRWAIAEAEAGTNLAERLRAQADHRFTPPGAGPERR
jgi:uncharacterized protein (TIGR03083 family)